MSFDYSDLSSYEFIKTLGEGNFGKVKLAKFKPTNEEFAIKIMNKRKIKQKMKNTIFRENDIVTKFNHINIAFVYALIDDIENYYIIMEYCKGGELFDYIVEHRRLDESEASYFFYQLINGVEYIHSKGVSHRDLKPENLLLSKGKIIKIIDFGLSHEFDGKKLLKTKCGSPSYAAPELIKGEPYDGFKTDIWCCGIILYAMVCGFLPFEGDDDDNNKTLFEQILNCSPEIPDNLSEDVKFLIKAILTSDPDERINIEEIKKSNFYNQGKKMCDLNFDGYLSEYYMQKKKDSCKEKNNNFKKESHSIESDRRQKNNIMKRNDFIKYYINFTSNSPSLRCSKKGSKSNLKGQNNTMFTTTKKKFKVNGKDNLNYSYKFAKIDEKINEILITEKNKTNENDKILEKLSPIDINNLTSINTSINEILNNNKQNTIFKGDFEVRAKKLFKILDPKFNDKNKFLITEKSPDRRNNLFFIKQNENIYDKDLKNNEKYLISKDGLFKGVDKKKILTLNTENNNALNNSNQLKELTLNKILKVKNKYINNLSVDKKCANTPLRKNIVSIRKFINKTPNRLSKLMLNNINININTININNNALDSNIDYRNKILQTLNTDKRNNKRGMYLSTEKSKCKNTDDNNKINDKNGIGINLTKIIEQSQKNQIENLGQITAFKALMNFTEQNNNLIKNRLVDKEKDKIKNDLLFLKNENDFLKETKLRLLDKNIPTTFRKINDYKFNKKNEKLLISPLNHFNTKNNKVNELITRKDSLNKKNILPMISLHKNT